MKNIIQIAKKIGLTKKDLFLFNDNYVAVGKTYQRIKGKISFEIYRNRFIMSICY